MAEPDIYEPCIIPKCSNETRPPRNPFNIENQEDLESFCSEVFPPSPAESKINECSPEQFSCQPGECIYSKYICDGVPDCSNGLDEQICTLYSSLYNAEINFKLQSNDEAITRISLEECARRCTQSKGCTCSSFSYNKEKQRCLLGNRYITFH